MLIRIETGELKEFPEDLAALILADPSCGEEDKPEFTAEEVNALLHAILGTYAVRDEISFEENIERIRKRYEAIGQPSEENLRIAQESIQAYVREIKGDDIGMVDNELIDLMFLDTPPKRLGES
ncbi:hypothetical protein [Microbulbifer sp. THAF38]|uniref:hypothetical protein n=1 Tax=Microbulbifer sp. THAF38 TaxID=2587856 RepID=UPI0012680355|nr:hypothetical protein [Microbulbifer sp. THAF38]QFT56484.1 hypothetical protein FIU95_18205 [Microbulbifer sp. THAF38]